MTPIVDTMSSSTAANNDVKDMTRALATLSPNLIHSLGKCRQRWRLSSRMRCTVVDDQHCIDRYRRLVDKSDDCRPVNTRQMAKYLDLIDRQDLKQQAFSRLQSRYLLRRISRVSLRPIGGQTPQTQDISSLDLCSYLRRVCFRNVETLTATDIETIVANNETFCGSTECYPSGDQPMDEVIDQTLRSLVVKTDQTLSSSAVKTDLTLTSSAVKTDQRLRSSAVKTSDVSDKSLAKCAVMLTRVKVCPNCMDVLFNRSHKNSIKRKYHSCLKGRINNEVTDVLNRLTV